MNLYVINNKYWFELENLTRLFFPNEKINVYKTDENITAPCIVAALSDKITVRVQIGGWAREKTAPLAEKDSENELQTVQLLYQLLRDYTGVDQPWGLLTGVRPIKLFRHLTEEHGAAYAEQMCIRDSAIPFEVQIRTWEMHYTAEYGIAAHWKYKLGMGAEGKNEEEKLNRNIERVKKMILDQLETEDATDIARNIRNDFEENDVYVFTPKGDVMSLPRGSTPIDLAYLIHTQVGHRMVGAKVNNRIVPIDYVLRTGDICEILTQKEEHPNRAWIDICKTASAKSKIRQWFKREKRDENIVEGKAMVEREFRRQGMNFSEDEMAEFLRNVSIKRQYNTLDDFYAAVGYGGIQLWKIMPRLKEEYQKTYAQDIENITVPAAPVRRTKASSGVVIEGNDDVLVKFSNCCNPLPGDDIIGYITRGYGVSIHKRSCTNVPKDITASEEPERWVNCYWEDKVGDAFRSTLQITAADRTGLLADVTIKLSNMHINIHTLNSRELKDGRAVVTVTIDVMGRNHLRGVISKLSDINGIEEVKRL